MSTCILTLDGRGSDGRLDRRLFLGDRWCRCRRLFRFGRWRGLWLGRLDGGFRPDWDVLVVGETNLSPVRLGGGGLQGLRGRQEDDERQQAQSVACNHFGAAAVYALRPKCVRFYWTSCRAFVRPSVRLAVCLSVRLVRDECLAKRFAGPDDSCVWCVHRPIRFDVVQCHGRGCVFIFISHGGGQSVRPSCTRAVT